MREKVSAEKLEMRKRFFKGIFLDYVDEKWSNIFSEREKKLIKRFQKSRKIPSFLKLN